MVNTLKFVGKRVLVFFSIILMSLGLLTLIVFYGSITHQIEPQFYARTAARYSKYYAENYPKEHLITPGYLKPLYYNATSDSESMLNKTKDIYIFTANNIDYVDNYDLIYHNSQEYYQKPVQTLAERMGDCEDFAFFIVSMLRVENNLTFPATVPGHTFATTCINNTWYRVDPPMRRFGELKNTMKRRIKIDCSDSICPVLNKTKILRMCYNDGRDTMQDMRNQRSGGSRGKSVL